MPVTRVADAGGSPSNRRPELQLLVARSSRLQGRHGGSVLCRRPAVGDEHEPEVLDVHEDGVRLAPAPPAIRFADDVRRGLTDVGGVDPRLGAVVVGDPLCQPESTTVRAEPLPPPRRCAWSRRIRPSTKERTSTPARPRAPAPDAIASSSGARTGANALVSPMSVGLATLSPKISVARSVAAWRSRRWHDPKRGQAPLRWFMRFSPPYLGRSRAATFGAW